MAVPLAHARARPCDDLDAAAATLRALACEARRYTLVERIAFADREIHRRVAYRSDGDIDHWATPFETLARGCGDCEDVAIAKRFLLDASGVPRSLHRLLYARWRRAGGQPHMAAVARDPCFDDPWVLDGSPVLFPLSARDDLEPVFSFDDAAVWRGVDAAPLPRGPLRAAAWLGVLERTRAQRH